MLPEALNGVRYWALWYQDPSLKNRFQVYRYRMYDTKTGLYWFESVRGPKHILNRNHYQLNLPNFKPFLIKGGKDELCQSTNIDASNATNTSSTSNGSQSGTTQSNAPIARHLKLLSG